MLRLGAPEEGDMGLTESFCPDQQLSFRVSADQPGKMLKRMSYDYMTGNILIKCCSLGC